MTLYYSIYIVDYRGGREKRNLGDTSYSSVMYIYNSNKTARQPGSFKKYIPLPQYIISLIYNIGGGSHALAN